MPRYDYVAKDDDDVSHKGRVDGSGMRRAARAVVRKHWPSLRAGRIKWKLHLLGHGTIALTWADSGATGRIDVHMSKQGPAS